MFAAQILINQLSLRQALTSTLNGYHSLFKKCNMNANAKSENKVIFCVFSDLFFNK